MFKDVFLNQFPKELNGFVLNFKEDIQMFYLDELIKYCEENKLIEDNFKFLPNEIEYNYVLMYFFLFSLIEDNNNILFLENKLLLKKIILDSILFKEENVAKNLKNAINVTKNNIISNVSNISEQNERTKIMNSLVVDSVLDKNSLVYQLYSNPLNFIENILPLLPNHFNKYYEKLIKEEKDNLDILNRNITKEQVDILIAMEVNNILEFCTNYEI